ncbi:hypothetical protein HYT92_01595 [Candidatus Pacearchaeota archaeon]|nr:hypothetical protein [Candidatus Pacearchaeota archaeon]
MIILSSKEGVFTIECITNTKPNEIFRHFTGWGKKVICPYCGETKSLDTLRQEAEARKEGENLVLAGAAGHNG